MIAAVLPFPAWWWTGTGGRWRVLGRRTAALLAFRKREYRTVVVAPGEGLTVVMERTGPGLPLPRCGKPTDRWTFQVRGAGAGREFRDIDYRGRSYSVRTRSGRHKLQHGRGPLWSYGVPSGRYLEQAADAEAARKLDVWMDRVCVAR